MMPDNQPSTEAVRARVRQETERHLALPLIGEVRIPPPDSIGYDVGIGVLAALEVIEWPVAVSLAVAHFLIHRRHASRIEKAIGEALEEA
jgi:hypothetical protein